MILTEQSLKSGACGVQLSILPPGNVVSRADDDYNSNNDDSYSSGLTIHDTRNHPHRLVLEWKMNFFENLHMDLSTSTRDHLNAAIHRHCKELFEDRFRQRQPEMKVKEDKEEEPRTEQFSNELSPLIDLVHTSVRYCSDKTGTSTSVSSTPALVVVHRTLNDANEEIVMGRLFLPVRKGLFEVIVRANEKEEEQDQQQRDQSRETTTRTTTMVVDEQQPLSSLFQDESCSACVNRVRNALSWLMTTTTTTSDENNNIDKSTILAVTERPMTRTSTTSTATTTIQQQQQHDHQQQEVKLTQLRCRLVPPPRFAYCPNPSSPESNKQRFCRASFGGTEGVQMMVVSCWYEGDRHTHNPNKEKGGVAGGVAAWKKEELSKVAVHGARVIHESQQLRDIRIETKVVALNRNASRLRRRCPRWLCRFGSKIDDHHQDDHDLNDQAIVTIVNCTEAPGMIPRQNTIGWIREPSNDQGTIYLVYFVDTLNGWGTEEDVTKELLDTLTSIRVLTKHHHHDSKRRRRRQQQRIAAFARAAWLNFAHLSSSSSNPNLSASSATTTAATL